MGAPFQELPHLVALLVDGESVVDKGADAPRCMGIAFLLHLPAEDVATVEKGSKSLFVLRLKVVNVVEGNAQDGKDSIDA